MLNNKLKIDKRFILKLLVLSPAFLYLYKNKQSLINITDSEEFIVIGGWVMLKSDLV